MRLISIHQKDGGYNPKPNPELKDRIAQINRLYKFIEHL